MINQASSQHCIADLSRNVAGNAGHGVSFQLLQFIYLYQCAVKNKGFGAGRLQHPDSHRDYSGTPRSGIASRGAVGNALTLCATLKADSKHSN